MYKEEDYKCVFLSSIPVFSALGRNFYSSYVATRIRVIKKAREIYSYNFQFLVLISSGNAILNKLLRVMKFYDVTANFGRIIAFID